MILFSDIFDKSMHSANLKMIKKNNNPLNVEYYV